MRNGLVVMLAMFIALYVPAKAGANMHGFKLVEKRFVQEVNSDCYLLQHEQSGARVLKIANNDPNKTFCISFKTVTESDGGTPHILEHSVLNGSKNFPVKSPFDVLSKGSLNTFLKCHDRQRYHPLSCFQYECKGFPHFNERVSGCCF